MKRAKLLLLAFIFIGNLLAADRYWIAGGGSNWNNTANWSLTNGGAGGASVPGAADRAIFNNNGLGNCTIDIAVTLGGLLISNYNGSIDLNGNIFQITSGDADMRDGSIDDGTSSSTFVISTTGTANFRGTTFNRPVSCASDRLYLNGSVFNDQASLEKTGANGDGGNGGNTFNGATHITNSGSGYLLTGNTNPDIFNGVLSLSNTGSNILYLAHNSSGNQFNQNILIEATGTNSGIRFCQGGGTPDATLAASRTIGVTGSGVITGDHQFDHFTQTGATAQSLTFTGDAIFRTSDSDWGGDLTIVSPRVIFETSLFNGLLNVTKNGAGDDNGAGGNTFTQDVVLTNSGSGELGTGNGNPDDFQANLTLNNSGSDRIRIAINSAGNTIAGNVIYNDNGTTSRLDFCENAASTITISGDVTISVNSTNDSRIYFGLNGDVVVNGQFFLDNSCTGDSHYSYIAYGTDSQVTFNGPVELQNNGTGAIAQRVEAGVNGDVVFNGVLTATNTSACVNSEIFFNLNADSHNDYNENVILNATDPSSDGIRFGQSTGSGTLAAGKTISVGVGGFIAGELWFRNFTQVGATAQNIVLTGDARFYDYDSDWGGDVVFTAPRMITRGTTYNGTARLEKSGGISDDASPGGNTFVGDALLVNSGSNYFLMGNGSPDIFQSDLEIQNSGSDRFYLAYNSAGNTIAGDFTLTNSGTGTRLDVCSNSASTLTVGGNTIATNTSTADMNIVLAGGGTIDFGGTLDMINSGVAANANMYLASGSLSSATIDGAFSIVVNNGITDNSRAYIGNEGDVVFNSTVLASNFSVANNSDIFFNQGTNSVNNYNGNITVEATDVSSDGISFGSGGGAGTLAATYTVNVGVNGFVAGELEFRNFTQVGPTAQSLTCTGTARIYNYDSNWGGDVTFIAPRMVTRGTTYNGTSYLEKTGATDDQSVGGNLFVGNCELANSGSDYFMMGNGTADVWQANLVVTNSGSDQMYLCHNSAGNTIAGTLDVTTSNTTTRVEFCDNTNSTLAVTGLATFTNTSSGDATLMVAENGDITFASDVMMHNQGSGNNSIFYFANGTDASVIISGDLTIDNSPTATADTRSYIGSNGDITVDGTLTVTNASAATNSEIRFNYSGNSTGLYNGNIIVESTDANSDGITFGENTGNGTLAGGLTVTIGGGGFIAGDLEFRNFTQVGPTAQALTCTGTSRIYNYDSNWGGDVQFIAPRMLTRGTTYIGTSYLEKTGALDDQSAGGNTFVADCQLVHTGSNQFMMGNGTADIWQSNLDVDNVGSGNMYIANAGATHSIAGTLTWDQSATGSQSYLGNNAGSILTVGGNATFTNLSGTGGDIYIANNGTVDFAADVDLVNTPTASGTGAILFAAGNASSSSISGNVTALNNGSAPTSQLVFASNGAMTITGDCSISNQGTGSNSYVYIGLGSNSVIQIDGTTDYVQSGTISTTRGYLGYNGDVTFNGIVNVSNASLSSNSEVYLNYGANSANNYNNNITVTSENATCDGVRFGQGGGTGTLAAGRTVTVGAGGFVDGDLRFQNFNQLGGTAQNITLTGSARILQYTSDWSGAVVFTSPNYYTRETIYQSDATITKNGTGNDDSFGGNTYNGTTVFTHSGAGRWRLSSQNGYPNDHNADVTYVKSGAGAFEPSRNNTDTYSGDLNFNTNTQITLGAGGNGRVLMDGGIAQAMNDLGATPNPIFRDLQINKTADDVTLNLPIEISVELDLDQGRIFTNSTNLLYMRDNSTVSSVSNASHVDGPMEKIGNDAFTFPVGNAGIYAPCSITAPSNASHRFRGQYYYTDPDALYSTSSLDVGVDNVSRCEYWTIDRTNGASNVTVNLSFENVRSCGITDPAQLLVVRWDGSQWENNGNGGTTGTAASGTINSFAPISNFSPFTLASTDELINPLPVELVSWKATLVDGKVELKWITETEINNDYFEVERSVDGINWESVLVVEGAGNSTQLMEYLHYDTSPLFGLSYYRLKQVDFDGTSKYFDIQSVNLALDQNLTFYPNPVKDILTINGYLGDIKDIRIYNSIGQEVFPVLLFTNGMVQVDATELSNGNVCDSSSRE
ncbi:MAG: hypothetical protein R2799_02120 [Crocinitomicaceae bacterium]